MTEQLIGEISRVEDSFAYAKTERGDVYIPITAARTSKDQNPTSLKEKFAYRDEVFIIAFKQDGKNSCKWQAKKVTKIEGGESSSAVELSAEIFGPVMATVTSAEASFGFAHSEQFGIVFLPGDAFNSTVVKRVNGYIQTGDMLVVHVQEQKEYKNCKWKAVNAVKHFKKTEDDINTKNVIMSIGKVTEVTEDCVLLWDESKYATVRCTQLTYLGGLRGKRTARTLADLITEDESIMYKAELTMDAEWFALEWKQVIEIPTLETENMVKTTNSWTQTVPGFLEMICRSMLREYPAEQTRFARYLPQLPMSALPDNCREEVDTTLYKDACN